MSKEFIRRIQKRKVKVAVIGQGYVGLPLSLAICKAGFSVVGFDRDKRKVKQLRQGKSYITDIASEDVRKQKKAGRFFPTDKTADLCACQVFLLCVPTPLTKQREPDLRFLKSACATVIEQARPPFLVSLESTSYPGTTEEFLSAPLKKKYRLGKEAFVVYSPERIDPGNREFRIQNTPKLIAGSTLACRRAGKAFYSTFVERLVPVSKLSVAETAKVYENVYRSVNIALVNELALLCEKMKVSVWEVIDAAATKPYGFTPFYPGPGLGGHCIPVDPFYLAWKAREYHFLTRFIELSGEVNWYMPFFVVYRIRRALNRKGKAFRNARVLILGVSYKPDIADVRVSPALTIMNLLEENGARVSYHDPFVSKVVLEKRKLKSVGLTAQTLKRADIVVLLTAHSSFDLDFVLKNAPLLFDTRGKLTGKKQKNLELL